MPRPWLSSGLVAEKNLLKIHLTNKYIYLQVVNNRSGHVAVAASTQERGLREQVRSLLSCVRAMLRLF